METKYNFELIKDFLDGTLDVNTSNQISNLIQNDETARDIAKGILLLKNKFETDADLEAYLNRTLHSNLKTIENNTSKKTSFTYIKVAAAIIFIAISSYMVYQFSTPSMEELVAQEVTTKYQAPPVFRNSSTENDFFARAMDHYNVGEFGQAAQLLESSESVQGTFYRGLSLLYEKDYEKAATELSKQHLDGSRFGEQAQWYLVITLLKAQRTSEAKSLLEDIVNKSTHYKSKEAKAIMHTLD